MFIGNSLRLSVSLSFDNSDWSQLDTLFADAGRVAGVDHVSHVLVGLGCFLHDQLRRSHSNRDSFLRQLVQNFLIIEIPARLCSKIEIGNVELNFRVNCTEYI